MGNVSVPSVEACTATLKQLTVTGVVPDYGGVMSRMEET
jgi:hypothetical protein